jgi:hypothetical protein
VRAVGASDRQLVREARDPRAHRAQTAVARGLGERGAEVRLSDAGLALGHRRELEVEQLLDGFIVAPYVLLRTLRGGA